MTRSRLPARRNAKPLPPDEHQLRIARIVQEGLLPPPLTSLPDLEVAARFMPSRGVGGDFYDYFPIGAGGLGLYLGDVQGKGLEAAMYALLVSGLMRGLNKTGNKPASVIDMLNRRLCFRNVPGKFCCLGYAVIDRDARQLFFANAGLPFPLLQRGGSSEPVRLTGSPVGLFDPCEFDQVTTPLLPGDRILFYTDGLGDVLDHGRGGAEAYLSRYLTSHPDASATALADGLMRRLARRPRPLLDDATFIVVRMLDSDGARRL
ncbi:MAG TPA: PP2C family protein-serine/threonine phosphatase [Candidatus Xenobia bacterium]|nr:PP2C family protein-serine/threonine phosphatase [Candidatus Xenobia bacterium]